MSTLEKIKEKFPLDLYIEQITQQELKSVGTWKSLKECPFCGGHDCFRYNPQTQSSYCFQCFSFCADAIHFKSLYEKISWKDAFEKFCQEMGIKKYDKQELDWISLRELACEYMREVLFTCPTKHQFRGNSIAPLQYLTDIRKHSLDAILNFRLGFNDGTLAEFLEKQYTKEIIKASGLNMISANCFVYPFIVNNAVKYFRIKDPNKIKKFQMSGSMRSKEAIWYNQDVLKENAEIWVCEGEDDAISLWDCGIDAVASCGILTSVQINFLKTFNLGCVYSAFDNDETGKRDTNLLIRNYENPNLFIAQIQGGKDIDDLIKAFPQEDKSILIDELKQKSILPAPELRTSIIQNFDGFYIEKYYNGVPSKKRLTNWIIILEAIIYSDADETATWKCKLKTDKMEKTIFIPTSAFASTKEIRQFLLNLGSILYFTGNDNDLTELIHYFSVASQPKKVIESDCVGETKHGFISENVFISPSDEIKPLTNGYLAIDNNMSLRIVPLVKKGGNFSELPNFNLIEPAGGIENFKKHTYDILVKNRNLKTMLAVGWAKSVFWSQMFYNKKKYFPLLWLHGKTGSGKSVFATWLMSMMGMRNCNPEMLTDRGTTEVGLARKFAYYSSLPVFTDDYRIETGEKFHAFFRGVYDRTSATKGLKSEFGVRRVIIRGCSVVTGEHAPNDAALFSRCVAMELTQKERKDKYFKEIVKLEPQFSAIGFDWLKNRNKNFDKFMVDFDKYETILQKEFDNPRQGSCYALAVASILAENYLNADDLLDFTIKLSKQEMAEQKSEGMISHLWECLDIVHRNKQIDENEAYCDTYNKELQINLPNLMGKIKGSQWTRSYEFPNNREIAKLLKQEDYVKECKSVRVIGKVSDRWIIDLLTAHRILKHTFLVDEKTESEVKSDENDAL